MILRTSSEGRIVAMDRNDLEIQLAEAARKTDTNFIIQPQMARCLHAIVATYNEMVFAENMGQAVEVLREVRRLTRGAANG